ncbi:uncharacterized [Tachysurus ichikawai]
MTKRNYSNLKHVALLFTHQLCHKRGEGKSEMRNTQPTDLITRVITGSYISHSHHTEIERSERNAESNLRVPHLAIQGATVTADCCALCWGLGQGCESLDMEFSEELGGVGWGGVVVKGSEW